MRQKAHLRLRSARPGNNRSTIRPPKDDGDLAVMSALSAINVGEQMGETIALSPLHVTNYAAVTITIRLRFDGRSTAIQRRTTVE